MEDTGDCTAICAPPRARYLFPNRDFRSIWTLAASVQPSFVLGAQVFVRTSYAYLHSFAGLTATLRPRDEVLVANSCGIASWEHDMRASCRRLGVTATCQVYEDESAAICALIAFKPQLVCVKSKRDMDELAKNPAIKTTYQSILLHYRDLAADEKVSRSFGDCFVFVILYQERAFSALHSDMGLILVIATSGITTGIGAHLFVFFVYLVLHVTIGTNPQALFRTVLWKGVWTVENAVQCIGRTARQPGQVGNAVLLTWQNAVQDCAGSDFARLASRPSIFFEEAVRMVDCDRGSSRNTRVANVRFEGLAIAILFIFDVTFTGRYSQFSCITSWSVFDNFCGDLAHGNSMS